MNINFKQPKYVLPVIVLPFLFLFFHVYMSTFGKETSPEEGLNSLQGNIADVSDEVKNRALTDKLDAYRRKFRGGDGYTAIGQIRDEQIEEYRFEELYNEREKHELDSLQKAFDHRQGLMGMQTDQLDYEHGDRALEEALSSLQPRVVEERETLQLVDPMDLFRQQMALADSMAKANDPDHRAELERQRQMEEARLEAENRPVLSVAKEERAGWGFNTIRPEDDDTFIQAIVDEDVTGYAGSRLRLRLLEDIMAGNNIVRKGTYLYAEIAGFTAQRVRLTITSIVQGGRILPVSLEVYDYDGGQGLYVPESAFREFSRDLGSSTTQGTNLQQVAESNNQLVMGVIQRMFTSTTSAVSRQIRKNKAKLKYNTLVYLIDPQELRKNQESY